MIKALILDRDGLITHNSSASDSPFYYIGDAQDLILKPNVKTAFALIASLAQHHDFKVILATKQRAVGKGIITRKHLDIMHDQLQVQIDYWFDAIYVEENEPDKGNLFAAILSDFGFKGLDTLLIDDSGLECHVASTLNMRAVWTADLYTAICREFQII